MPREKQKDRAERYGKSFAEQLFADMMDATNRGPKFRWSKFPDMAFGMAKVSCYHAFRVDIKEIVELAAGEAAKKRAVELLKEHGLDGDMDD
jgi:hypothetical protein